MAIEKIRAKALIRGRVQGVGFRYFAERHANVLGITGFVRNLFDGSVEVVAEGERNKVDLFLKELERGPHYARVENVDLSWHSPTGEFGGFSVRG